MSTLYNIKTIAHRGVHNNIDIPENSLLAFKKAKEQNLPIELDIQLTKDNQIIVFHDYNLKRMTNIDKNIKGCTYKELSKIRLLKTKEKIPLLKEVLKLINGKVLLDIEIKNIKKKKELINILLQELETYKGKYIIKSFNPIIIHKIKKQKKNIDCGLLLANKYKHKLTKLLILNNLTLKYCNPDFLAISKKLTNNKKVLKFQKEKPILIWTIDNEEDYNKYNNNYICICNKKPGNKKTTIW